MYDVHHEGGKVKNLETNNREDHTGGYGSKKSIQGTIYNAFITNVPCATGARKIFRIGSESSTVATAISLHPMYPTVHP